MYGCGGATERSTFKWHGHLARVSWAGRPCHEGFSRASDMAEGSFVASALGVLHFAKAYLIAAASINIDASKDKSYQWALTLSDLNSSDFSSGKLV